MENDNENDSEVLRTLNIINWDNFLIGTFNAGDEVLEESMINSMNGFARLVPKIRKASRILVISSGNTFLPRYLASNYGCNVTVMCADDQVASDIQNDIAVQSLGLIKVVSKDLYYTGLDYNSFDMVWSVATLYKRHDLIKVLVEINRLLAPQGRLILWEPTKSDRTPDDFNEYIIHSGQDILKIAGRADFENVYFKTLKNETLLFYKKVENEYIDSKSEIRKSLSEEAYDQSLEKLKKLYDFTNEDRINWNFIQFQKRNA